MKAAGSLLLVAFVVQEPVCEHPTRGESRPVDLGAVARVHAQVERTFEDLQQDRAVPYLPSTFDSGLPACRTRGKRRIRVQTLPAEMRPLLFAPAETRTPPGAILIATRARSIADIAIPADPELAARFGVRCAPTLVRPVGPEEVELVEGD
ncbi:MAG TPA: hypothetical protein VGK61_01735 [Planctomycetota bacterium]